MAEVAARAEDLRRLAQSRFSGERGDHTLQATARFFGGLSIEETAHVLEVSPATVKLDWSMVKAWLFIKLQEA